MAEREKGVASVPCPNCDAALSPVMLPDGGVTVESCGKCYPAPGTEKAAAKVQPRETGTDVQEAANGDA